MKWKSEIMNKTYTGLS